MEIIEQAAASATLAVSGELCANCGSGLTSEYCPDCGQHSHHGQRLSLGLVWKEFASRFLKMETGLLRTVKEMTLHPGRVIEQYVHGKRRTFTNPFSYLLLASAVSIIVVKITGVNDLSEMNMDVQGNVAMEQGMQEMMSTIQKFSTYISLGLAVVYGIFLRIFFRKSSINLAESTVFGLYAFGHISIVASGLTILALLIPDGPTRSIILGVVAFAMYCAVCGLAAYQYFDESWKATVKSILAVFTAYLFLMFAIAGMSGFMAFKSVTSGSERQWTPFIAIEEDRPDKLAALLETDSLASNATRNQTVLHLAVELNDVESVEALLESGADVNAKDELGRTPLFLALHFRSLAAGEVLLEKGNPDLDVVSDRDATLLMEAANHGHDEFLERLAANGSVNATREDDTPTALHSAVGSGGDLEVQMLLDLGADPNLTVGDVEPVLIQAVRANEEVMTAALLSAGADPNVELEGELPTALFMAAKSGNTAILTSLLDAEADPSIKNSEGKTADEYARMNAARDLILGKVSGG